MEKKKQIKISLKTAVLLMFILLAVVATIVILVLQRNKSNLESEILKPTNSGAYKEVSVDGKIYYQRLSENTWQGQYHQESFHTADRINNIMEVVSYSKYLKTIDLINSVITNKIKPYYSNENWNYIILGYANGYSKCEMELIDCLEENNKIIIYGNEEINGVMAGGSGYFIAIPTNMAVGTKIEYRECYTRAQINNLKELGTPSNPFVSFDKPIIYLYPEEEIEISIKLGNPEKLTCSYPEYTDEWKVIAKQDGTLTDVETQRELYALYWEGTDAPEPEITEGFIVKGEDTIEFLEEKLEILGLNEKEAEEFIIYWLPKMQNNEYNYIRFATMEEINEYMPLEFSVQPDSIIRILMQYKAIDEYIEIPEQQLETPTREGFVVVEWGGTEIK